MIKFEHTEVLGWEHAIRGMRNPLNSWDKSDSFTCYEIEHCELCHKFGDCPLEENEEGIVTYIGPNDLDLMTRLRNAGTDHRKFMRMLTVYVDITAPLYWWKEFDTYKVGTVANSCSTMHKIHAKEFTLDDFSREHLDHCSLSVLMDTIVCLNNNRKAFIGLKDKQFWWQMIQLLPTSYNQKRTVMLNYEVLANMYQSRKAHKLDEWLDLCKWVESLPYAKELICGESNRPDREAV